MTTTALPLKAPKPARGAEVPPLEVGERLSAREFERRYWRMPRRQKWELVEGVAFMASPVNLEGHGLELMALGGWLHRYLARTAGTTGGVDSSLRLDRRNMPQPDAMLLILPECGGGARRGPRKVIAGVPELVAEVANSSRSIDLGPKLQAYSRNGIPEYLVWRTRDRALDWFRLRDGAYERLPIGADGIVRSVAFPGLWLRPDAATAHDWLAAESALDAGLASPEHAAFVAELARRRASKGTEA